MANAKEIARIFAYLSQRDEGKLIEKTRLNKLLYFAQGHALVELGRPLFQNKIDAWEHGPVVAVVYTKHKKIIDEAKALGISDIRVSPKEMELVLDVWEQYRSYKAKDLVDMTHQEGTPWKDTYVEGEKNVHIPIDLIERYFLRPENKLNRIMDRVKDLPVIDALPADEYDPSEDSVWEALLNDAD